MGKKIEGDVVCFTIQVPWVVQVFFPHALDRNKVNHLQRETIVTEEKLQTKFSVYLNKKMKQMMPK